MKHLDKLEISNRVVNTAMRRRTTNSIIKNRRKRLIASIEKQIELVEMSLNGKPLQLQRTRGRKVISVKPRIWWVAEADGVAYTQIRFHKVALTLSGRGSAIKVGKLSRLPSVLPTAIKAVNAGELDRAIENAEKLRS